MGKGMLLSGSRVSRRVCAVIAAVAIALGMPAFSVGVGYGVTDESKAAESVAFVNGDFEIAPGAEGAGWETWKDDNVKDFEHSQYAKRSGSYGWAAYFNDSGECSIYQAISLDPGKYTIQGYTKDTNNKDNQVIVLNNKSSLGEATDVGKGRFSEFSYTLDLTASSENTENWVTIKFTGSEGAWICIDDVVITKNEESDTTDPQSEAVDKTDLKKLIDTVPADLTTASFTSAEAVGEVKAAKAAAEAVYANSSATEADIDGAYKTLGSALDKLSYDSTVYVTKLSDYDPDSIRGVDVSSYISIMNAFEILNSGISDASKKHGFRDASGNLLSKQGFFNLLAKSGINYVRTRVWVDPKDSSGNLYGGGNNDVTIAKEIATYVTNAGMKNLIDFHLSDLWTDPSKQRAPKAWKNMTIDDKTAAVRDHITSSLKTIESEGAIVSMVQVGNETNNGVAGETSWTNMDKIFDAGCDAVHAYEKADNRNKGKILAAVHFADPNKGQYGNYAKNLADYDGDGDGEKEGVSYV